MNIFVSDPCPVTSARVLDNKRMVKMVLESCQLLSSAMHINNLPNAPYWITHRHHPCTKWTSLNRRNFEWLLTHFIALLTEYTIRYKKQHACAQYVSLFCQAVNQMPEGELTMHPNCTKFKHIDNVYTAYKIALNDKWAKDKRKPNWHNNCKPIWCEV